MSRFMPQFSRPTAGGVARGTGRGLLGLAAGAGISSLAEAGKSDDPNSQLANDRLGAMQAGAMFGGVAGPVGAGVGALGGWAGQAGHQLTAGINPFAEKEDSLANVPGNIARAFGLNDPGAFSLDRFFDAGMSPQDIANVIMHANTEGGDAVGRLATLVGSPDKDGKSHTVEGDSLSLVESFRDDKSREDLLRGIWELGGGTEEGVANLLGQYQMTLSQMAATGSDPTSPDARAQAWEAVTSAATTQPAIDPQESLYWQQAISRFMDPYMQQQQQSQGAAQQYLMDVAQQTGGPGAGLLQAQAAQMGAQGDMMRAAFMQQAMALPILDQIAQARQLQYQQPAGGGEDIGAAIQAAMQAGAGG
jgi:hypothetical protein